MELSQKKLRPLITDPSSILRPLNKGPETKEIVVKDQKHNFRANVFEEDNKDMVLVLRKTKSAVLKIKDFREKYKSIGSTDKNFKKWTKQR